MATSGIGAHLLVLCVNPLSLFPSYVLSLFALFFSLITDLPLAISALKADIRGIQLKLF
jgi:hypothetical protein